MSASLVGSEMCIRDSPSAGGGCCCPSFGTSRKHFFLQRAPLAGAPRVGWQSMERARRSGWKGLDCRWGVVTIQFGCCRPT
eukprot:7137745-Alexandrium_andersonii.AAC.1